MDEEDNFQSLSQRIDKDIEIGKTPTYSWY